MNSISNTNQGMYSNFSKRDIETLKNYFEVNKRYSKIISAELQTELAEHPVFGPLIKMQTPEQQKAQNEHSLEMQRAAIFDGKWEEYSKELMAQGIMYARMNINYVDWYDLIKIYKKRLIPHLKKDFPESEDAIYFIEGLTMFLDYAMYGIAEAYFAEKNNIIKAKEDQFRAIFENSDDNILLIDKNLNIIMVNRVGVDFKKENIIGKSLLDIQSPESFKIVKNAIDMVFKTKVPFTFEIGYGNEEKKYFLSSVSPIFATDGGVENLVFISHDISVQKRGEIKIKNMNAILERKVNERTEQLKKTNGELEQFVYAASHDLQEPLRTISNFTKLLTEKLEEYPNKEINEYVNLISGGAKRMSNLIIDLLQYSRVGRTIVKSATDCDKLLLEILTDLAATIQESDAEIKIKKLPIVNSSELKPVFQNLISNAIKFRRAGTTPIINISVSDKEKEFLFAIKDNGIGIENEYYDRIFLIFQRLHTRTEYDGTGIGLSLCKKIIELNGGKIWVESELGIGSTFYFTIPKN